MTPVVARTEDITLIVARVRVPETIAPAEETAKARALIFAQLTGMTSFPRVESIKKVDGAWVVTVMETGRAAK